MNNLTDSSTDTTDTTHRAMDGRYYTDADIFEQELDRVFARTW